MVTIKDIAREAKVSVSTVSFALNGTAPVAPETKRRILEIVERLQYQPSASARSLVTRKTNNIALFVPQPGKDMFHFSGNSLFSELLQGIGEVLHERNYNLLLAWEHEKAPEEELKALQMAKRKMTDGILLFNPENDEHLVENLNKLHFPFVLLGKGNMEQPVHRVDVDNFEAAFHNTTHMIKLGHKRIAFISPGPLKYLVCSDRYDGYREALEAANIKYEESYVYIGDDNESSGYQAAESFCGLKDKPTAIISGRDIQAVGILAYCAENQISVPDDLAVVSFENSDLAVKHGISSLSTDLYQIGKEGTRLLLKNITRSRDSQPQNIVIPFELNIRKTCGAQAE
ncbi:LacI family DNA-binding transcriptional regulator [Paenibacillus mendelii]|uniref:LacI family DNA-binding transcriptional regulator n=1 Tax=Paenibacillus mendelii TaxID=206163 RepID=A0ABV6JDZ8_9BACL|nr:LacI family DNA-binding transcriptional regulator [Paenibacillus mendelii]MCQ6560781.1 LacI family transcriptional regulator [Paenibacillus mendelii]